MEGENAGAKQELAAIAFNGPAAELIEKRFRDDALARRSRRPRPSPRAACWRRRLDDVESPTGLTRLR
jgi:hypothetical protein